MAKRDEQQRKIELLEKLALQRRQITHQRHELVQQIEEKKAELKDKINVPKRIKSGIQSGFANNPTKWFIGSAIGGLLISKFLFGKKKRPLLEFSSRREKSHKVSRGLLASALIYFGKPMLKRALINRAKTFLLQRYLARQQQQRP